MIMPDNNHINSIKVKPNEKYSNKKFGYSIKQFF